MSERRCPKCERETTRAEPAWDSLGWRECLHCKAMVGSTEPQLESLAEAARIHVESEARHAYRTKELEAKLAEAENRYECLDSLHVALKKEFAGLEAALDSKERERSERHEYGQKWQAEAIAQRERAEAAEARVRVLEETMREMHRQRATVYTPEAEVRVQKVRELASELEDAHNPVHHDIRRALGDVK